MLVSWWRHQMKTFSDLLALCAENSPVTADKGQWHGSLIFSLICNWINGWVYNREVGDLRPHRTHYNVIVMCGFCLLWTFIHGTKNIRTCQTYTLRFKSYCRCGHYVELSLAMWFWGLLPTKLTRELFLPNYRKGGEANQITMADNAMKLP